jgi:hypothetical protein
VGPDPFVDDYVSSDEADEDGDEGESSSSDDDNDDDDDSFDSVGLYKLKRVPHRHP